MITMLRPSVTAGLRAAFGARLHEGESLARHTSARIGGRADFFVVVYSAQELAEAARTAWRLGINFIVLGAGSNILVSDKGFRGLVIHNRARKVEFRTAGDFTYARAESGMSLPGLARMCILRGVAGLEWAATVPGTVGGAVFGNAGAHGAETADSLHLADILQQEGGIIRAWAAADLKLGYRRSLLKASPGRYVVLAAEFQLGRGDPDLLQSKVETYQAYRRQTQPPGASIGSMFRNPPNDYAGRLVESVGLKGKRIGAAEISSVHANFFVNLDDASAQDVYELISLAQATVRRETGVELELEIELVGDWGGAC